MKKLIIKKISRIILIAGVVCFTIVIIKQSTPNVDAGGSVDITASIAETVTCSAPGATSAFGALSLNTVTTASPNSTTTVSCNSSTGCNLSTLSTNGGLIRSGGGLIVSTTDDLAVASEGYGAQASVAAGTGATFSVSSPYNGATHNVGKLATTTTQMAVSSGPTNGQIVTVVYKTKVSAPTLAGSYSDSVTYGCTAN